METATSPTIEASREGRRTGDRLTVKGCNEATRRVGLERRITGEKGEAVRRKLD
jgi:hypothetical protein